MSQLIKTGTIAEEYFIESKLAEELQHFKIKGLPKKPTFIIESIHHLLRHAPRQIRRWLMLELLLRGRVKLPRVVLSHYEVNINELKSILERFGESNPTYKVVIGEMVKDLENLKKMLNSPTQLLEELHSLLSKYSHHVVVNLGNIAERIRLVLLGLGLSEEEVNKLVSEVAERYNLYGYRMLSPEELTTLIEDVARYLSARVNVESKKLYQFILNPRSEEKYVIEQLEEKYTPKIVKVQKLVRELKHEEELNIDELRRRLLAICIASGESEDKAEEIVNEVLSQVLSKTSGELVLPHDKIEKLLDEVAHELAKKLNIDYGIIKRALESKESFLDIIRELARETAEEEWYRRIAEMRIVVLDRDKIIQDIEKLLELFNIPRNEIEEVINDISREVKYRYYIAPESDVEQLISKIANLVEKVLKRHGKNVSTSDIVKVIEGREKVENLFTKYIQAYETYKKALHVLKGYLGTVSTLENMVDIYLGPLFKRVIALLVASGMDEGEAENIAQSLMQDIFQGWEGVVTLDKFTARWRLEELARRLAHKLGTDVKTVFEALVNSDALLRLIKQLAEKYAEKYVEKHTKKIIIKRPIYVTREIVIKRRLSLKDVEELINKLRSVREKLQSGNISLPELVEALNSVGIPVEVHRLPSGLIIVKLYTPVGVVTIASTSESGIVSKAGNVIDNVVSELVSYVKYHEPIGVYIKEIKEYYMKDLNHNGVIDIGDVYLFVQKARQIVESAPPKYRRKLWSLVNDLVRRMINALPLFEKLEELITNAKVTLKPFTTSREVTEYVTVREPTLVTQRVVVYDPIDTLMKLESLYNNYAESPTLNIGDIVLFMREANEIISQAPAQYRPIFEAYARACASNLLSLLTWKMVDQWKYIPPPPIPWSKLTPIYATVVHWTYITVKKPIKKKITVYGYKAYVKIGNVTYELEATGSSPEEAKKKIEEKIHKLLKWYYKHESEEIIKYVSSNPPPLEGEASTPSEVYEYNIERKRELKGYKTIVKVEKPSEEKIESKVVSKAEKYVTKSPVMSHEREEEEIGKILREALNYARNVLHIEVKPSSNPVQTLNELVSMVLTNLHKYERIVNRVEHTRLVPARPYEVYRHPREINRYLPYGWGRFPMLGTFISDVMSRIEKIEKHVEEITESTEPLVRKYLRELEQYRKRLEEEKHRVRRVLSHVPEIEEERLDRFINDVFRLISRMYHRLVRPIYRLYWVNISLFGY